MELGMYIGFASMLLGMLWLLPGVKKIRATGSVQNWNFGWAFLFALIMGLMVCIIYSSIWTCYIEFFNPDWMDDYAGKYLKSLENSGINPIELEEKVKEMESYKELYKTPFGVFFITLPEPMPIALLMALVSGFVWRKRPHLS